MRRIRIAFCTDGIYPEMMGGMQKHSRLLVENLANYPDLDVFVIHPHPSAVFSDINVKEISLKGISPDRFYLGECYNYSKRVFEAVKSINPDIVYSQGLSIWYKAAALGCKLVINPHGLEPYQALGFRNKLAAIPFKILFNFLFRRADVVISLGGKLTGILRKAIAHHSRVVEIPNGVYLPKTTVSINSETNTITGLFLARFAHNKGIGILFEAIDYFSSRPGGSPFRFLLGGKGPLYDFYKNKPGYPNATLLGFVKDEEIPGLYQKADFFVFPTLFEGMPTVVLEAMSFGLPVIVSDVGATRELVDDTNGRVIKPGSAQDLIDALEWFEKLSLSDRSRLSENSRSRVDALFTWEKVTALHHKLFRELFDERV